MPVAKYFEIQPTKELLPLVNCFWISANNTGVELKFSTLPDGCIELIVSYQNNQFKSVKIFGVMVQTYDEVFVPAGELKFGIRLKPLAQEYYLDKCSTLDRFANFSSNHTGDFAADLLIFAERVTADMLNAIDPITIDKRKIELFNILEKYSGNVDVRTIAENSFWSARQINRYINRLLGIPLKTYSNILKCYSSYKHIKIGDLTPSTGYYDQSHFIREIKKHTGTTPKVLSKNEADRYLQFNASQ